MKIWYLLIGFVICAAGTSAIQPSVGFLGAEDATQPTPFLVFGHVWYEGGSPCNSPIVNITSNGTSLPAETRAECNYYQILLSDVSDGDVIEWSVPDGAGSGSTNRTVDTSDLERGGIFGVDLTLESQPRAPFVIRGWVNYTNGAPCDAPGINITNPNTGASWQAETLAGYSYYELILNSTDVISGVTLIFNATDGAGFNITNHTVSQSDLVSGGIFEVNLTLESPPVTPSQPRAPFVIRGWVNYTNGAPCDAPGINITNPNTGASWQAETLAGYSYYELILNSTDIVSGVTLIFNATDGAGFNITSHTISQSDLNRGGIFGFNLTLTSVAPRIREYDPPSPVNDTENATRRFNITIDQVVDVTWWINGSEVQTNTNVTNASYTNTSAVVGIWNVSARANNTNGTDMQTWIWNVNAPPAPNITSFAPPSHVRDTENATRTFNITIDQVVDVTWLINETVIFSETNVNKSSYTNTSAVVGVWYVSARANNTNGTDMQTWIWNVNAPPAPNITSFAPPSHVRDTENVTRTFNITIDQVVDVTWLINETVIFSETNVNKSSYTNTSAAVGVWYVSARANNTNGTDMQTWIWNVTAPSAPNITSFLPQSPVYDTENKTQTFEIRIDQIVNVIWRLNGTVVQTNESVTDASYTNTSAAIGVWNVSARVNNTNGTDTQEWIWHVTPPAATPPSSIVVIYGEVFYENNTNVDLPCVVITNLNTGKRFVADNRTGENFYQLITDASEIHAGDLLLINASKDGEPIGNGSVQHTVTQNESRRGAIRVNINQGWADLQVVGIFPPTYIFDNETGTITARVANNGTARAGGFNASLAVDGGVVNRTYIGSLGVGETVEVSFNWTPAKTGYYTLNVTADSDGEINESDETNNSASMTVFVGVPDFTVLNVTPDSDYCVIRDTVGITATVANLGVRDDTVVVEFYDNGTLNITRTFGEWEDVMWKVNDTITIPSALAIRVHFSHIKTWDRIEIYDKNDSNICTISEDISNHWTGWIPGDTIKLEESYSAFTIDKYQALLATETISLNVSKRKTVTASYRNATQGLHNLSVAIDPHDTVPEYNETNNSLATLPIYVDGFDLVVTDVIVPEDDLYVDDTVNITATIDNWGAVNAGSFTVRFVDEIVGKYLFSWGEVPGNERQESNLLRYLRESLNISQATEDAEISKSPEGELIIKKDGKHLVTITIENEYEHPTLKIGSYDHDLKVKEKDDELKIYAGANTMVFNETLVPPLSVGSSINITVPLNLTGMAANTWHNIIVSIPFDASPASRHWPKDDNNMADNTLPLYWYQTLPKWDFSVEDVTVSPSEIREGDLVNITATIGNLGHVAGDVSIGFYIDMWATLPGSKVGALTYCDCLGAARGWSRDDVSNATGRYIKIGSGDLWLDADCTNTTTITWNAFTGAGNHTIMVVTDPDERLDEYNVNDGIIADTDVETEMFGNNNGTCLLNITSPDLSITGFDLPKYADVGDLVDITAVVRNNESMQANSTLWWVVEGNKSVHRRIYDWVENTGVFSMQPQHEAIMMRAHFVYLHMHASISYDDPGKASIDIVDGNNRSLYSKTLVYGDGAIDIQDRWMEWGYGNTLKINAYTSYYSEVKYTIDKYQVVIGNETITLDANDYRPCNTIWNATVPPGNYTVWVDVEDQNKTSTILVNETDLAVTELSVPDEVLDGDLVEINLTISNLGQMDAGNFTVEITDLCETVIEKYFSGLAAGDSIRISVPWTASLKNGSNHAISVEVTPDYELPEINRENDKNETWVHISESRDFSVADLTFTVNNITRAPDPTTNRVSFTLGEIVTMNATVDITNLANRGGSVDVGFYFDAFNPDYPELYLINGTTVPISYGIGNGTGHATLNWRIDNFGGMKVPGNNSIIVVADPDDKTVEFNDSNNKLDPQDIYIRSPDLVVEEIAFDPKSPEISDLVNITATVGNLGDKSESNVVVAYVISRKDEHIESPHEYPNDWNYTYTIHAPGAHKMRIHFGSIKIRHWYIPGTGNYHDHVYVYDMNGSEIHDYQRCHHGNEKTTNWIDGDSVTVKLVSFSGSEDPSDYRIRYGTNWGFLIDRIDMRLEDRTSLDVGGHKNLSVIWNASRAGQYDVDVTIDPENEIPEHCESNNTRIEGIEVQGADLTVSNLTLTVNNRTVDQIIEHGDPVNITATIANIGVRDAHNINVSFSVGVTEIDRFNISLSSGESINISTIWDTTPREYIGDRTVKVFADCDYAISETNELNNTLTEDVYVCTAELSGGNISWHPAEPLDEDMVTINATITNSGCVPAENFTVLMFYDRPGEEVYYKQYASVWGWSLPPPNETRSYDGAEWVYVRITHTENINQGDLIVYDRNNTKVASPDGSCWIAVPGDTARVEGTCSYGGKTVMIRFYAVYSGNLLEVERLGAGSTTSITIVQKVTSFNHTVTVHIDPEGNVIENNETDNTPSEIMYVIPTRDFTVTDVTAARTTNLTDTNTTEITAAVANIGFRNGTTDVAFVDYEWEGRAYNYAFSKTLSPPYAPVSPQADRIIHRPGVDAIELDIPYYKLPSGRNAHSWINVRDGSGNLVWEVKNTGDGIMTGSAIIYVEGDTATIWRDGDHSIHTKYTLHGYTTIHEFNRTEVMLNATNTTNESKTVTLIWTASTGDHIITAVTDPDDKIGEIDESNNNKSTPLIHVAPSRDPVIINITNTPLYPMDGDDVTITAEVRNNGNRTANFTVDFWEDTRKRFTASSSHISVPGASWVDLHLTSIVAQDASGDPVNMGAVWAGGAIGDTPAKIAEHTYISPPMTIRWWRVGTIDAYYDDWYKQVDEIRYKRLINRTHITLLANETGNVTAVWEGMSIADLPEYNVIVIVDPEDEIDEIDEGNNEMSREIVMNYPDFTVGHFDSATKNEDARVKIKNIGVGGADYVNVSFELARREDYSRTGSARTYTIRHKKTHDGREADNIRVHFDYINIDEDKGGNLLIAKSRLSLHGVGGVLAAYYEDVDDVWSPWVKGDQLVIASTAKSFKVDGYEWGEIEEETIYHLGAHDDEYLEIPEEFEYICPENLTVRVNPDGEIPEFDEENNERTVLMYADLRADAIAFGSPGPTCDKLSLDAEKFVIYGYITNGGGDRGDIVVPVSDFNVTLEFKNRYPNGTDGDIVFNMTKRVKDPFYTGHDPIRFEFDPNDEFEVGGNYTVRLIADSTGDVCESDDELYSDGEENNVTSRGIYIHNSSGYTGGGELINVAKGEVHGRVVYTVGDSKLLGSGPGAEYTVNFDDVIPNRADVGDIELARLFVYWYTWHYEGGRLVPVLLDMDVDFNDEHNLKKAGNYSDNPVATRMDGGYGLYSYDVTNCIRKGGNVATVTRGDPRRRSDGRYDSGIHAIGLLVVYEDCDEPLTKYWVNEGADIMMAGNSAFLTGLPDGDCITTATFDGVEQEDTENVDATLLTVLGFYTQYGGSSDALEFNDRSIGSLIDTGYWIWHYNGTGIALTNPEWEDVTDHLKRGDNLVEIQSIGNFMMPNNAFLRLIFPPDLNVIDLTAPSSTVVGAHHSINVTIRNDGRSDAHDFNVTFYIDGKQMARRPGNDLPAGENMTIHLYNWTPMLLMHVYNLTAAADVLSGEDWTEVETDNNALTKYVNIEEGGFGNQTGPRGIGGGGNPTGGEYTETITGRIMEGAKFLTFGGGGGAGMFSALEWVMKSVVWLVLVLFVYAGYRAEQRSYGRVRVGLRQPY